MEENDQTVEIPMDGFYLNGILNIPSEPSGIVIFAHGSGSSRLSPRNKFVARKIQQAGIATLLFDLLTEEEDQNYQNRFDIDLLARRLQIVTEWVMQESATRDLKIGYFGASTGSAAAIKSAVGLENNISSFVSRGGRVDMSASELPNFRVPTLLIVGGGDADVLEMNERVYDKMEPPKKLEVILGATHLFEEEGALEEVARLAIEWYSKFFN